MASARPADEALEKVIADIEKVQQHQAEAAPALAPSLQASVRKLRSLETTLAQRRGQLSAQKEELARITEDVDRLEASVASLVEKVAAAKAQAAKSLVPDTSAPSVAEAKKLYQQE